MVRRGWGAAELRVSVLGVVEAVTGLSGATFGSGVGALIESPLARAVPGRASVPPVVAVVWHQTMPAEGGEPALVASSVL